MRVIFPTQGVCDNPMARQFPLPHPSAGEAAGVASRRDFLIPAHAPGMRIGLFGGTFDPPHEAHLGACLLALRRLHLDRVWWLVTPGNPLKDTHNLAPLTERIAAARRLARHPRIAVTGIEAAIGARFTYDTVAYLVSRCPGVHFVWIMGADNLRSFHRWRKWRGIASLVPMVVIDRLGPSLYSTAGVAGRALAWARRPEQQAPALLTQRPPAWVFLHGLKSPLSSTALRALRQAQGQHEAQARILPDSGTSRRDDGAGALAPAPGKPQPNDPAAEHVSKDAAESARRERKWRRGTQGG